MTGVDVGYKYVGGKRTDEIVVRVHVSEKKNVPTDQKIPETISGVKTDVLQNRFELAVDGDRYDPLQGGGSLGPNLMVNLNYTAGTLGAIVNDNASGDPMLLTNYHVLCISEWRTDTIVTQPSPADGGLASSVGHIVRSSIGGQVDCALSSMEGGNTQPRDHINEIKDIGPVTGVTTATFGAAVRKRGRTTGLTYGTIDGLYLTASHDYGTGMGIVTLTNQITIIADSTHNTRFADHGDSGSVIVDSAGKVVGLLCAITSDGATRGVANPIQAVLDKLNVSMAICGLEIEVRHNGGYVARYSVEYDLNGQHKSLSSGKFMIGENRFLTVPLGATNIHIKCEDDTGLAWNPWRTIFDKTYPGPAKLGTRKTFKITGTTLNPTYGEDATVELTSIEKSSSLAVGAYLGVNDYLVSDNDQCFAIMQNDGNFVLYHGSGPSNRGPAYWSSGTARAQGQYFAVLKNDANFAIYQGSDPAHQGALVWNCGKVNGHITVENRGGYVARCSVKYDFDKQRQEQSSGNFNLGQNYSVTIPVGSSNIQVKCEDMTGLVWDPWKTILDKAYSTPPQKTITLRGTTLNPNASGQ